jgi:cytidylate kinase
VEDDIRRRDRNDTTRNLAPLKPAPDAVIIDSSDAGIDEVIERMLACIRGKAQRGR